MVSTYCSVILILESWCFDFIESRRCFFTESTFFTLIVKFFVLHLLNWLMCIKWNEVLLCCVVLCCVVLCCVVLCCAVLLWYVALFLCCAALHCAVFVLCWRYTVLCWFCAVFVLCCPYKSAILDFLQKLPFAFAQNVLGRVNFAFKNPPFL